MKHFGVFLTDLESERFTTASSDQITAWLFLHAFCSKQTNGGTIKDARSLPERFWSRHGIDGSILGGSSPLWSWNGEDLSVEPYDIGGEELYLKKSKGGKDGAEKRWKGSENGSPNGSPNAPNLTRPNLTKPDQTLPNQSSSGDEGEFFDKSSFDPSTETNPLDKLAESIYQEYPRKVSKKEGIKAIKKAMKSNTVAFLKSKTMEYATATTGHDKQFIPHPSTWFNEERFNDDPKEWERSNKSSPVKNTQLDTSNRPGTYEEA
jgi:hypothetical protein